MDVSEQYLGKLVYENDLYEVRVGFSENELVKGALYKVRNKTYGVVEVETPLLYQAVGSADDLQGHNIEVSQSMIERTAAGMSS